MKIDLKLAGQGDTEYLGELIEQIPEGLLVSCQKELALTDTASCTLQITAGNILYCWDKAAISPAPEKGAHAFKIVINTRPGSITAVNTPVWIWTMPAPLSSIIPKGICSYHG